LVIRNAATPVAGDSISLVSYEYPAERKGNFECSDPVLMKVWKAGVATTYLHMEDALVCDAVRERRVWTGDGAHGLYGIYAAFGDLMITDWFFRLMSRGQLADGMLRMYYPGTDVMAVGDSFTGAPAAFENPVNIPQFALFYGLFVGEHYRYFGKRKLVEELYPALVGLAGWCERHADESGLLCSLTNWNFTDWAKTEMEGANLETNALYYKVLQEMTVIASDIGKAAEAEKWRTRAAQVRDSIRRQHWNPQRGLYADSVIDGKRYEIPDGAKSMAGLRLSERTVAVTVNGDHHHLEALAK
jgi:alpha-L-rhamnosidase